MIYNLTIGLEEVLKNPDGIKDYISETAVKILVNMSIGNYTIDEEYTLNYTSVDEKGQC